MTEAESVEQPVSQNPLHPQISSLPTVKEEPETDTEHRKNVLKRIRQDKESGASDQIFDSNYKVCYLFFLFWP